MILTAENVRAELGLSEHLPAGLSEDFFGLLREVLISDGRAEPLTSTEAAALPARLPGTAILLRGTITEAELLVLVTVANLAQADPKALIGGALALRNRVSRLRIDAGELSVVRVLGRGRRTAADIASELADGWCPTPRHDCVFLDDGRCRITVDGVEEVLRRLEKTGLVETYRMIEPAQYRFIG